MEALWILVLCCWDEQCPSCHGVGWRQILESEATEEQRQAARRRADA